MFNLSEPNLFKRFNFFPTPTDSSSSIGLSNYPKYNALYHQTQRSNSGDHTHFSKNLLKNSAILPSSLNTFLKNFTTGHSMQTCHPIRSFRLCHFLARKTSLLCFQLISNSNQTTKIPSFPASQEKKKNPFLSSPTNLLASGYFLIHILIFTWSF